MIPETNPKIILDRPDQDGEFRDLIVGLPDGRRIEATIATVNDPDGGPDSVAAATDADLEALAHAIHRHLCQHQFHPAASGTAVRCAECPETRPLDPITSAA